MNKIKKVDNTNKWSCQFCTYLNPVSAYPTCLMCEQSDSSLTKYNSANNSSQLINTSKSSSSSSITTTSISVTVHDRQNNDEINAEKLFHRIQSYCRKNKIHFVDDQFPPSSGSIGYINHSYQWLRISQIRSLSLTDRFLSWSVYLSSSEPSDIQQGELGDCWLLAALALITERPEMLEHIVLTKEVNAQGVYLIRLCHHGLWKTIVVDDCFPCTQDKQLAYSKANRRQLYVPLIEKACAKLFGSYADLIGGKTEEGLQLLTGSPCTHIDLNPHDHILDSNIAWAKLLSACEAHLLIGATTGRRNINEEEYQRIHIHSNHAFSILAAYYLSEISMPFVLVRDPHARVNYREEIITSSILSQLNSILPFHLPSGAFWISWPVFLQFFNSITISSYANDYYDIREVAKFTRSSIEPIPTFHFYVSKTSIVDISLHYHCKRRQSVIHHIQSFVLCNIEHEPSKAIGTRVAILQTHRGGFTHWTGSLSSGTYILIPFSTSFWDEKNHELIRDYTLVIHSKIPIDLHVINESATALTDCLIATIPKENFNRSYHKDFKYYSTPGRCDFVMFIAQNLSSTNYLNIDIDMNDSMYIRSSRQSFITHDCIPPKHKQIIFLTEWINQHSQTAKLTYVYQTSFVQQSNNSVPAINIDKNDFHSFRRLKY
ncbi:unnamed protein product [Rotaria sordida]|uniref:Calpain catalytic domain-containing protein n=1 Tax=Rotaria sordida TaxID=392033 RepID=A0A819I7P6_9BILA|nr:unnamed protein product [Rotaria sordida]CAF3914377.1 unnamed protein product [Rotaria sordida]